MLSVFFSLLYVGLAIQETPDPCGSRVDNFLIWTHGIKSNITGFDQQCSLDLQKNGCKIRMTNLLNAITQTQAYAGELLAFCAPELMQKNRLPSSSYVVLPELPTPENFTAQLVKLGNTQVALPELGAPESRIQIMSRTSKQPILPELPPPNAANLIRRVTRNECTSSLKKYMEHSMRLAQGCRYIHGKNCPQNPSCLDFAEKLGSQLINLQSLIQSIFETCLSQSLIVAD